MGLNLNKLLTGMPFLGGLFDDSEEKAEEQILANRDEIMGLNLPKLAYEEYKPEMGRYLGDLQASKIAEDPAMIAKQKEYLTKLAYLGDKGLSEEDALANERALDMARGQARSEREAIMQNARARGVAGSAMEMALRNQSSQGAAESARQQGMESAAQTARQRALYTQAYGSALGSQRDQDYRANAANSDIINKFNEMNMRRKEGIENANVDLRNRAKLGNIESKQDLAKYGLESKQGSRKAMENYYWQQALANEKKREAMGAGAGALVGGALGGPEGAKVGYAAGGAFGKGPF